jgi:hypothetical protein
MSSQLTPHKKKLAIKFLSTKILPDEIKPRPSGLETASTIKISSLLHETLNSLDQHS